MRAPRTRLGLLQIASLALMGTTAWAGYLLVSDIHVVELDSIGCPAPAVQRLSWHFVPHSPTWISNQFEAF